MRRLVTGAGRAIAVAVAFGAVLSAVGGATPARADHDHDRVAVRHDRDWRDNQRRVHEWHDRGRVYYGDRVYVDPPPAVVYAPPPPPAGLNLMFSFGR